MRTILGIVFALVAFPANAIVVTGEANSYELAQEQAFKKAIDHEVGVIVDTERFAVDSELVHNQILTYSAGYILDYNVISHSESNGVHTVKMDVTVASSKLKNFLLSHASYSGLFVGKNLQTQIKYYNQGLLDKDKLIANTVKYFPHEAMNIVVDEYAVSIDENRNYYLEVSYTISWDKEFLTAFKELLYLFANETPSRSYIEFNNKELLYFNDHVFMQLIYNRMTKLDFVEISLNNLRNDILLNTCVQNILYDPDVGWNGRLAMYSRRDKGISIFSNKIVQNYMLLPITNEIYSSLHEATQINLSVTTMKDCPGV